MGGNIPGDDFVRTTFSYGVEIFPQPLVKLIGHVSPYIHRDVNLSSNMYFWVFLEFTWKTTLEFANIFAIACSQKLIFKCSTGIGRL